MNFKLIIKNIISIILGLFIALFLSKKCFNNINTVNI